MAHTLIVIRHAKSDWDVPVSDHQRPLAKRGRRQAPPVGRWLAEHDLIPDVALVSSAQRARETWEMVAAEIGASAPQPQIAEAAYTFSGALLLDLVNTLPDASAIAAVVGHNPAVEELVRTLTGQAASLPTAAIAVVDVPSWPAARRGSGRLVTSGRPADGTL
ncbi:MAG: histidine phosphatase family protein [Tetrasphaera sp.]